MNPTVPLLPLHTEKNQIVDASGRRVLLRGTGIGGWMNLENFINAYPGTEWGLRQTMAEVIGASRAQFFFDRLLDHFFSEADIIWLKAQGCTVVRLPLNYRHFESDLAPGVWIESGFARLQQTVDACARHGLYVILDLHAVQGWQNTDWHSDNPARLSLFWESKPAQDRFVALWEELARRFCGNPAVAAYDIMNEPHVNEPRGKYFSVRDYRPRWDVINAVYRRTVTAIRTIDPDHIIALEGDYYSVLFDGFEAPFAPNLLYSSHNYTGAGFGPGPYPGVCGGEDWSSGIATQREKMRAHQGLQFSQRHSVPLWAGEFGSVFNGPASERTDRLRALDDQLTILGEHDVHWTTWTYKDPGVMGMQLLNPECEYLDRIRHVTAARMKIGTDFWMGWLPSEGRAKMTDLAGWIRASAGVTEPDAATLGTYLNQAVLEIFCGGLLQRPYAECFRGLSENELDRALASFSLAQCRTDSALLATMSPHLISS